MIRATVLCLFCALLSSSWLKNMDAQFSSEQDSGSIIQSIATLSKVLEGLRTEIQIQSSVVRNLASKEELESILLGNLATKSDMQMQNIAFQTLKAKAATHDNSLSNLQAAVDELKTLLIKSSEKEDEQVTSLSNLEAQSNMQTILHKKVGKNLENQTSLLNNLLTTKQMQVNNMTNMEADATTDSDGVETLAEGIKNSTTSKGIVEGIIAGTSEGLVIIPLDSREPRTIPSNETDGVTFNWQSHKVYWIYGYVGIKIADIDGSHAEVLISDPYLRGLAVDQITGNLYWGFIGSVHIKSSIQACDSMGKKCVTIASGANDLVSTVRDIALFPAEGIMFWSNDAKEKIVIRANMDGTKAFEIFLESINGLNQCCIRQYSHMEIAENFRKFLEIFLACGNLIHLDCQKS